MLHLHVFNGDVDEGSDTVENYGASVGFSSKVFSIGADYLSNVLDTDGISGVLDDNGINSTEEAVEGLDIHASLNIGPINLIAE